MDFSKTEIDNHKKELRQQINRLEKEVRENPLKYSETLQINNLYFLLSELDNKKDILKYL